MRTRVPRIVIAAATIVALSLAFLVYTQARPGGSVASAKGYTYSTMPTIQKRILSGLASLELSQAQGKEAKTASPRVSYFPTGDDGCSQNIGSNVKVNQNCLNVTDPDLQGRGQAQNETAIAQDPYNPSHIITGYNDYRRGDGNCYGSFSLNGGQTWADTTVPMSFTRGTAFGGVAREYWQAGGDTSVAWDTRGNAYFDCQVFQRGPAATNNPDQSSAVYIFRSTQNAGASWNFPGRPVVETYTTTGLPFNDKPYMTVDNHISSPFRDRVYVTWTIFAADGTAYIWEAYSADYGQTFSAPVLVSSDSSLCPNTYGLPTPNGRCNENQFSDPFVGPDGNLYVTWSNFNNSTSSATDNHNQILLAKSTDGGKNFSAPVLVSNYYDLPDCATYQNGLDAGRACVPEKGPTNNSIFRATNYPTGTVNPTNANQVVVTFGSYINQHSNEKNGCVPAGVSPTTGNNLYTGVKVKGACNNDILVSVSNDSGATFTGTTTDPRNLPSVTSAPGQVTTDQWWQWSAFNQKGELVVSYFDRQYNNDEYTGFSDISLSASNNIQKFAWVRVTGSHMPPPTEFPDVNGASLFYGDYTGLTVVNNVAHPLWMDTRNKDLFVCPNTGVPGTPPALCTGVEPNGVTANDQDIFTASVALPALN